MKRQGFRRKMRQIAVRVALDQGVVEVGDLGHQLEARRPPGHRGSCAAGAGCEEGTVLDRFGQPVVSSASGSPSASVASSSSISRSRDIGVVGRAVNVVATPGSAMLTRITRGPDSSERAPRGVQPGSRALRRRRVRTSTGWPATPS